jgi:hypothetical protein
MAFVAGDGTTVFPAVVDTVNNITGLGNGNVVGRLGADQWRLYNAEGTILNTRQLDNLGNFTGAAPLGGGGYAAFTDANVVFMGADGDTVAKVVDDHLDIVAPLRNGNLAGHVFGTDIWRVFTPDGSDIASRVLDNSGVFQRAAALGNGGYAAATDSRIIFMAANGTTVNNVVTDVVESLTPLTNGNVVGRVGADVWRLYDSNGNVLFTRALDSLGTFAGATALGGGGYLAYTDTNAIFVAADGNTVQQVVPNALEFVTSLNNGRVVGRLVGTDLWRMYDSAGNILATRSLDNLGTFTGATATGLPSLLGDYDSNGVVNQDDYLRWRQEFGLTSNMTADGNGNGVVDGPDYVIWRKYLPSGAGSLAGGSLLSGEPGHLSSTGVPEPSTLVLLAIVAVCGWSRPRSKRW